MLKGMLAASAALLCLLALGPVLADDDYEPGTTHPTIDLGANVGGDKLATYNPLFGGHDTLYAGKSLSADFGVQHNLADTDWSLKATAGFDYWAATASNATITFRRYPLDLLALYNIGDNHIGFGLTEHLSPRLNNDGFAPDATFDNATGVILQYQYWLFGARLTSIRYKVSSGCVANCSFSGNSLSLFFDYAF